MILVQNYCTDGSIFRCADDVATCAENIKQNLRTPRNFTPAHELLETLYEDVCCARGDMENRIKKQQLMMFADRTR